MTLDNQICHGYDVLMIELEDFSRDHLSPGTHEILHMETWFAEPIIRNITGTEGDEHV